MRKLATVTATDEHGNTRDCYVDPTAYTSVHDWKPVSGDRFAALMHQYTTMDINIDDHGNGQMHAQSHHLGDAAIVTIHFSRALDHRAVLQPVLMTMGYKGGKLVCFAHLRHGLETVRDEGVELVRAYGGGASDTATR